LGSLRRSRSTGRLVQHLICGKRSSEQRKTGKTQRTGSPGPCERVSLAAPVPHLSLVKATVEGCPSRSKQGAHTSSSPYCGQPERRICDIVACTFRNPGPGIFASLFPLATDGVYFFVLIFSFLQTLYVNMNVARRLHVITSGSSSYSGPEPEYRCASAPGHPLASYLLQVTIPKSSLL
jgi:hypothetical protein